MTADHSAQAEAALQTLHRCRHEIESLDRELITLLARRVAVSKEIGVAKRGAGLPTLEAFCKRERCPIAIVGDATAERLLHVGDNRGEAPVDMPMPVLLGKAPRLQRTVTRKPVEFRSLYDRIAHAAESIGPMF